VKQDRLVNKELTSYSKRERERERETQREREKTEDVPHTLSSLRDILGLR